VAPPPFLISRRRRVVRLFAVAAAFVLLFYLGYRPMAATAHSAREAAGATPLPGGALARAITPPRAPAAPIATRAGKAASSSLRAAQAVNGRGAPPAAPRRHGPRRYRDANYLLDPFVK
jgi:hypothetical protein